MPLKILSGLEKYIYSKIHGLIFCGEKGFKLDKRHFTKFKPIKELGQIPVSISLHKEVSVEIKLEVVSENPIEEAE